MILLLWLLACDQPPDLHAHCGAPIACGSEWVRRCTDETGLLAHWDTADGRVSLWRFGSCDAVER